MQPDFLFNTEKGGQIIFMFEYLKTLIFRFCCNTLLSSNLDSKPLTEKKTLFLVTPYTCLYTGKATRLQW